MTAREVGLEIHPEASVDCLPGVASYVGADITAGVLSSGLDEAENVTLFLDVGTNGETVLGNRDWLVTCACSAGPAFEGAGVVNGMRATDGAIEEVWINATTYEPTYRVIGGGKPRGLCGSGLISLLSEMFLTGVVDKAGNVNLDTGTPGCAQGQHGGEYVVAVGAETEHGQDIVFTRWISTTCCAPRLPSTPASPCWPRAWAFRWTASRRCWWVARSGSTSTLKRPSRSGCCRIWPGPRFEFLGNTSVRGAYLALLDWRPASASRRLQTHDLHRALRRQQFL